MYRAGLGWMCSSDVILGRCSPWKKFSLGRESELHLGFHNYGLLEGKLKVKSTGVHIIARIYLQEKRLAVINIRQRRVVLVAGVH